MRTERKTDSYTIWELVIKQLRFTKLHYRDEHHLPYYSGTHPVIYLVLKGEYRINVQGKPFACRRNQLLLIKGNAQPVTELAKYGTHLFAFELSAEACEHFSAIIPEPVSQEFIKGSAVHTLITELYDAFEADNASTHLDVQEAFIKLLKELVRQQQQLSNSSKRWSDFFNQLTASGDFLVYDFADIAAMAGISTRQLTRCIIEHYGYNYRTLHSNMKVRYAAQLLRQGIIDMDEVRERCRFATYKSMSKEFKKMYHCTPHEYRERNK